MTAGTLLKRLELARGVELGRMTELLAEIYGDRPALDCEAATPGLPFRRVRTYRDLEDDVARLAAAHEAFGHSNGQRIIVATANRPDVLLHVLALARTGAVPLPVNPRLKAAEFRAVIEDSGASAVVADEVFADNLRTADGAPEVRWRWSGTDPSKRRAEESSGETSLAAWLEANPDARLGSQDRSTVDDTTLLLATSGTTGRPKLAALTSRGLLAAHRGFLFVPCGHERGPRGGRDTALCALPLVHVMGIATVLAALHFGVKLIFRTAFNAQDILDRIEQDRPNAYIGVPTMYADLEAAGAAQRDLSSVQFWVSGADAMPSDRVRRFQHYGAYGMVGGRAFGTATFVDTYGMVELSGAAAVRIYGGSPIPKVELPSVAVVLPGFEARVVDDSGTPVRSGHSGNLQIRGRGVLRGYEGRQTPFDEAGWLDTGDMARMWPGGVFTITGRSRDRLKVGGFSVFPAEVEEILHEHSGVSEVAVVGVPDSRLGERPVALVVPSSTEFDSDAFLQWASENVAGYRRPRAVVLVDRIPRGNHGKLDRGTATQTAIERLGTQESAATA